LKTKNKHIRNKFKTAAGKKISDREWAIACLPTKTYGCGLEKPKDIMKTVQRFLPGTKNDMQMIHTPNEDIDSHDFISDATKHFVRVARENK
jgi:hypothetical protein